MGAERNLDIRKVTLRDVAAHCGVSTATASKVLSGKEKTFISPATRERILKEAKALGYRANFGTRLMQNRSTGLIGLALARERVAEEEHTRDLLLSLTARLKERGLMSHLAQLGEKDPVEDLLEMMNVGCEAFIIFGSPTDPEGVMAALEENKKPYVAFQSALLRRNVESDTASGVAQILEQWKIRGLDEFRVLLPDTPYLGVAGNRMAGLRQAFPGVDHRTLVERHIRFLPGMEGAKAEAVFEISRNRTAQILGQEKGIQAILFYTDQSALGGIRALLNLGLAPNREVQVAGINESSNARYGAFPFTSMGHDIDGLANALLEEVRGKGDLRRLLLPKVSFRSPSP